MKDLDDIYRDLVDFPHSSALHIIQQLERAYAKAYNAAIGLTKHCSNSKYQEEIEEAGRIYRELKFK